MQFAAALREHFDSEPGDLRIITEIPFNTDGDIEQAVRQLQVYKPYVVCIKSCNKLCVLLFEVFVSFSQSPGCIGIMCNQQYATRDSNKQYETVQGRTAYHSNFKHSYM